MSQPLVYVDTSDVRAGKLPQLKAAIKELAEFIDENEPQLVSYSVYFTEDDCRMTVIHVHTGSASLDHHMDVGGPLFRKFADLVTLSSIHIYGEPSERALGQLRDKLRLLGAGDVIVHAPHAGFLRAALPEHGDNVTSPPAKPKIPERSEYGPGDPEEPFYELTPRRVLAWQAEDVRGTSARWDF